MFYKLGEIYTRITKSILPTASPTGSFNFVGLENIKSESRTLVNFSQTNGLKIKSNKTHFAGNDILYGKLRPYLNKVWLAEFDGICSTDIWVLRARDNIILPLLLFVLLKSQIIKEMSSASITGTNLPRANQKIFDQFEVKIPPLKDQQKIVEKLNAVHNYKKSLLRQKSLIQELFDSVLNKSMTPLRPKSYAGQDGGFDG